MLEEAGFSDVEISPPVDTFGGAPGEDKARAYDVRGYAFLARKPGGAGLREDARQGTTGT